MKPATQIPHEAHGRCRSCGAAILWARTLRGRPIPLDAEESFEGGGTMLFTVDAQGVARRSITGTGRRSHFSSCPDADRWRRAP